MGQLADGIKDREWALRAREMYSADWLETGAIQEAEANLKTYHELSEETGGGNPVVELSHAMRALLHGELEEANGWLNTRWLWVSVVRNRAHCCHMPHKSG
jgi:hypothetical protein